MRRPLYVSVDCEYTDGNFVHGRLLQAGLAARWPDGTIASMGKVAYVGPSAQARANEWVKANLGMLLARCRDPGQAVSTADLAWEVKTWLGFLQGAWKRAGYETTPVFVGWCGAGDWAYLTKLLYDAEPGPMDEVNPFHHDTVEIGSLAMGALGLGWGSTAAELAGALNIPGPDEKQRHDAEYDACWQLGLFEALMARAEVSTRGGALNVPATVRIADRPTQDRPFWEVVFNTEEQAQAAWEALERGREPTEAHPDHPGHQPHNFRFYRKTVATLDGFTHTVDYG